MADVKISALTAVPSSSAADVFAVVQGGTTKKETLAQIQATISATNIAATGTLTGAVVTAGDGLSGTYSSGNLTIVSGIITAIT